MRCFCQLAYTSDLPVFVSDIPLQDGLYPDRIRIPIDEPEATSTFYLLTKENAPEKIQQITAWIRNSASQKGGSRPWNFVRFVIF